MEKTGGEWQSKKGIFTGWRYARIVAASLAAALIIGTTTYAAMESSLLSRFHGESDEVQKNAGKLLDTNVKQGSVEKSEISKWVSTKVVEAVCDKNSVIVEIEAKPTDANKILLIPEDAEFANDLMPGLSKDSGKTVGEYAKETGKKGMHINFGIRYADSGDYIAGGMSIFYRMEKDGTVYTTIEFPNEAKTKNLNYQYDVILYEPEDVEQKNKIRESFDFTLTDQSNSESIRYLPVVENQTVKGTNFVVDEVTFEQSELSTVAKVKYRYIGETMDAEKWYEEETDADIVFFMFDESGKKLERSSVDGGSGTVLVEGEEGRKGSVYEQTDTLSLTELPDTITLRAIDVSEKVEYGEITITRK